MKNIISIFMVYFFCLSFTSIEAKQSLQAQLFSTLQCAAQARINQKPELLVKARDTRARFVENIRLERNAAREEQLPSTYSELTELHRIVRNDEKWNAMVSEYITLQSAA